MQINSRYFTSVKIAHIVPILFFSFFKSGAMRNPFCFSDAKINVPFSYTAIAKVHNCSKSFAVLSYKEHSHHNQNVIAKKGDNILGYKIVDIFDDVITVQDDKNNELSVYLK